jgi:3-oxoacyl-[acyl-carrier protein] reductase
MADITPAQQLFDLSGEVALVTGASSGLGARFAQVLAAHGAKVIAAGRRADRLEALAASHANIEAETMDVTAPGSFGDTLDGAEKAFGPLTLLVNNAGISGKSRILDAEPHEWRDVQNTNVDAVWHLSKAFAGRLVERGAPGTIINIASIVSYRAGMSPAAYAISKAAVLHMTKAMAVEWARHQIRVNAIAPGFIHSEMTDAYLASPAGEAMTRRAPQRRAGDPSDLDGALLLLASKRASRFMTGSSIIVDGGLVLA